MVERRWRSRATSSLEQGGGGGGEDGLYLPPGFRFHPTNCEIITCYLLRKFLDPSFVCRAIAVVDLNSCEPRELPGMAAMGEKEWYFFVHKGMKYPTGMRANRATKEGYWKATGRDREILSAAGELVGMKKTLVFYTGRAPRGGKTNWVMHEFRLDGKSRDQTINNPKDEWVVCKVFNKKGEGRIPTNAVDVDVVVNAENSAGTTAPQPNASSVSAVDTGDVWDIDSMFNPHYFTSSLEHGNSLVPANTTAATTTDATAVPPPPPPYNADYHYYPYSVPTAAGPGSFDVTPNYILTNTASNTQLAAATTNSVPTSGGGDGMITSHNVNLDENRQAIMGRAMGGFIGVGVQANNPPAIAGTFPQQTKLGSYDGDGDGDGGGGCQYAYYGNYDLGASSSASAKDFGGRLLRY